MKHDQDERVIEYSDNEDFILWVQSGFRHNHEFWQDLADNPESSDAIQEAVQLVKNLNFGTASENTDRKEQVFKRILSGIEEESVTKKSSGRIRFLQGFAIAASLALLVTFFWRGSSEVDLVAGLAENISVSLPDNSEVNLNAESQISYNKKDFRAERKLSLQGEAFFEVEKGNSFLVESSSGSVEVLGTSFNVYDRDGRFEVSCKTGRVRVKEWKSGVEIILAAGENCAFENGVKIDSSTHSSPEWTEGIFSFSNAMLVDVAEELDRQFDITTEIPDALRSKRYTGFFQNEDLDQAMRSVFWPLDLEYQFDDSKRILSINN